MKFCSHCGEQLGDDMAFCTKCGKTTASSVSSSPVAAVAVEEKSGTEKTFISTPEIKVTETRIITPERTCLIADIDAARSTVVPRERGLAIAVAVVALFVAGFPSTRWALLIFFLSLFGIFARKEYAVLLTSSSGPQTRLLVSKKPAYIAQIVEAINQAVASKR